VPIQPGRRVNATEIGSPPTATSDSVI
jgi:hypothetical protein